MATRKPGSNAGSASSTTITRFSVDVVITTTAPSDAWTSPSLHDTQPAEAIHAVLPPRKREGADHHAGDEDRNAEAAVPDGALADAL